MGGHARRGRRARRLPTAGARSSSCPTIATRRSSRRPSPAASPPSAVIRDRCTPAESPMRYRGFLRSSRTGRRASSSATARRSTHRCTDSGSSRSGTTATRCSPSRSARRARPRRGARAAGARRALRWSSPGTPARPTCERLVEIGWVERRGRGATTRPRVVLSANQAATVSARARPRPVDRMFARRARSARARDPCSCRSPAPATRPSLVCADVPAPASRVRTAAVRCRRRGRRGARVPAGAVAPPPTGRCAELRRRPGCAWRPPAASAPPTNSGGRSPACGSSCADGEHPCSRSTRGRRSSWRPAAPSPSPRAATARSCCSTAIGCCSPRSCGSARPACGGGRMPPHSPRPARRCTSSASPGHVGPALATWTPGATHRAELAARAPLRMPPTVRVAASRAKRDHARACARGARPSSATRSTCSDRSPEDDGLERAHRPRSTTARRCASPRSSRPSRSGSRPSVVARRPDNPCARRRRCGCASTIPDGMARNTLRVRVDPAPTSTCEEAHASRLRRHARRPQCRRCDDSRHPITTIVAVVTRRDAPLGRKRVLTPSPVAQAAERARPRRDQDRPTGRRGHGARSPRSRPTSG